MFYGRTTYIQYIIFTITIRAEPVEDQDGEQLPQTPACTLLYVRGAAIKTLDLKIFNRWGQLIFETTSQQKGWDGTYNGQPQPIEAYAYVLDVTFIDGTTRLLKGNITLLR